VALHNLSHIYGLLLSFNCYNYYLL